MVVTIKLTDDVAQRVRQALSIVLEGGNVEEKKNCAALDAVRRQIDAQLDKAKPST